MQVCRRLQWLQIDRQDLVHELDISYRDVRILDPLVSSPYPTALLIREKALVVNMEAFRMIICADQCYVRLSSTEHRNLAQTAIHSVKGFQLPAVHCAAFCPL